MWSFLAIKRCQRAKGNKVINQSRSSKKPGLISEPVGVKLLKQMGHACLPRPVRVQQHTLSLILNVKAHLGPVSQAQLLDYVLPIEMRTNTPSSVQVQFVNNGAVQCVHGQVLRNQGGRNLLIDVTLVHSRVSLYLPCSDG